MLPHTRTDVQCRVQFRELPEDYRPALVIRHLGITVVVTDPRATCLEMMEWSADMLSRSELDVLRAAHGQPPVGHPVDEKWMLDQPVPQYIPESLTLGAAPTLPAPRVAI